ncbi:MAG: dipeptidase [Clostridiales bacterium]|nr:dipeptidase [Clostridiales bacterium]
MQIIDLHCDTIMHFYAGEHLSEMENCHINLKKLQQGECMAQCFAIFVPSNGSGAKHGITEEPAEYFDKAYAGYLREMELNKETILPAYTAADVEKNYAAGKMSSILTVEDGVTLDGKIENVDDYYRRGVRMVSLTWNFENSLGYPQSPDPALHARGLKPFGIKAVRRMNELGIAVDVSHLSEGGFWDVEKTTTKPFIASHSCCRGLCNHSRNLTDEQLRALANKGGVCGINYLSRFLHDFTGADSDNRTSIEEVVAHLKHMKNVAGIDTLAMGSDYDGMHNVLEWGDYSGTQKIVQALEKAFTAEEVEKICWKNALRVFRDIIGE